MSSLSIHPCFLNELVGTNGPGKVLGWGLVVANVPDN